MTLALSRAGASVTLAYRGRSFTRAKKANKDAIDAAAGDGSIELLYQCNPTEITERDVAVKLDDGTARRLPVDVVFVLIGADLPVKWLDKVGVGFVERPHAHTLGATDVLIRALVPAAAVCPQDPAAAVAVMRGEALPEPRREVSVVSRVFRRARAASSRWVDSAVAHLRHTPAPTSSSAPHPVPPPLPPPRHEPTRVRAPRPSRLATVAGTIDYEPTIPFRAPSATPPPPPPPRRPRATPSPVLGVRRAPTGAVPLEPSDFSTGAQTIISRPPRASTDAERTVVMGMPPEFE